MSLLPAVLQTGSSPVILFSKASKAAGAHGKKEVKTLKAKTQKLSDFSVSGGFDVPDHPPGMSSHLQWFFLCVCVIRQPIKYSALTCLSEVGDHDGLLTWQHFDRGVF